MTDKTIDHDNLEIHDRAHQSDLVSLMQNNGVMIILTQAFGPGGDQLIGISEVTFDGYPAVTLLLKAGDQEGLCHLSPIHGDRRKVTALEIPAGTKCQLFCPVSKKPLDRAPLDADGDAEYFQFYLTNRLWGGESVTISDVWGHYHSRVVDDSELISRWARE